MIVVMVYRPETADAADPLEGVEVLGVYPDYSEDSVHELINELAEAHPKWRFHLSPGEVEMHPVEQRESGVFH
jgi:hypothetical protein